MLPLQIDSPRHSIRNDTERRRRGREEIAPGISRRDNLWFAFFKKNLRKSCIGKSHHKPLPHSNFDTPIPFSSPLLFRSAAKIRDVFPSARFHLLYPTHPFPHIPYPFFWPPSGYQFPPSPPSGVKRPTHKIPRILRSHSDLLGGKGRSGVFRPLLSRLAGLLGYALRIPRFPTLLRWFKFKQQKIKTHVGAGSPSASHSMMKGLSFSSALDLTYK